MEKHIFFMKQALIEAKKSYDLWEVPIGAIIEKDGIIIGRGHNLRNSKKNVLCHSEIIAINEACLNTNDWRLEGSTLYVTVEPCAMCAGAILQSRIKTVVFGTYNTKGGCCGSILNILDDNRFNHKCEVITNILEEDCKQLMQKFFRELRFRG